MLEKKTLFFSLLSRDAQKLLKEAFFSSFSREKYKQKATFYSIILDEKLFLIGFFRKKRIFDFFKKNND